MALARYNFAITDDEGNLVPGCTVEVRDEASNDLASIFKNRDGDDALANAFTAVMLGVTDDGVLYFHVAGGAYRITASKSGFSRTWRYVGIGTASETDTDSILGLVNAYREVTGVGAVTITTDDVIVGVNKNVGAATAATINHLASARDGRPVTIKDVKGDAETNNITPAFTGGELCDGLAGSSFVIATNYGSITFWPRPTGNWYIKD